MSKKIEESDTPAADMDQSINKTNRCTLSSNTTMIIIPPNILQDMGISDSMVNGESIVSALGLIRKDNIRNSVLAKESKDRKVFKCFENATNSKSVTKPTMKIVSETESTDDTDNEIQTSPTKVPKINKDNEKLIPKVSYTRPVKSSFHVTGKKKSKATNLESSQTTSKYTPKPPEIDKNIEQCSSGKSLGGNSKNQKETGSKYETNENIHGRSKRVRKQTKFDDYIISYKETASSDQTKRNTRSKEKKRLLNVNTLSDAAERNDTINRKRFLNEELQIKEYENVIHSVTPAITTEVLPLNFNSITGDRLNIKNNKNNSKDELNDTFMNAETVGDMELNDKNDNEIPKGSTNNSLPEDTKQTDIKANLKVRETEDLNDSSGLCNIDSVKYINTNTTQNENDVVFSTVVSENQNFSHQSTPATPPVRKRGRPRKIPLIQKTPGTLNESDGSLTKMDNFSIAETVIHSKRHGESSYNISSNDGFSNGSDSEDNTLNSFIVRKRGRPAGSGRGRGRGRGRSSGKGKASHSMLDIEYVPKLKGPTSPEKIKAELSSGVTVDSSTSEVICGKCEEKMPKRQWNSHSLLKHNYMCWIQGDEPLDFENNIKLCRSVLMAAVKKKKGKLTCEKCGAIKRSANGFISHIQFCGKSEEEKQALMMTCPICCTVIMPSSMEIHARTHKQAEQSRMKELQLFSVDNEKVKRKAAEKAVTKILEFTELVKDNSSIEKKLKLEPSLLKSVIKKPEQKKSIPGVWKGIWKRELNSQGSISCHQVGCKFTTSLFDDMCKHFFTCSFVPKECYVCRICKFSITTYQEMVTHVTEKHGEVEEADKFSDFEDEHESIDERLSYKFIDKEKTYKIHWTEPYFPAIHWTMEFEQRNYELHLYQDQTPNEFTLLKNSDAIRYLPQSEVSMRTKTESKQSDKLSDTETTWKQWKRFEGGFDQEIPTFFVGGPVWALAWLPIPSPMFSKEPTQYVAISTHPTMESEYTVGKAHVGPNIIQIWNVGTLDHTADNKRVPALSYALAHNTGTIWCLEWCPSGCYEDESLNKHKQEKELQPKLKRMGMLAAACSDGNVYIYSLPFPEQLKFEETEENTWPIYRTDPIMILVVNIPMYDSNDQNWQCTKLSWSKEHGHNTIAAGFSNGYIALWDLTNRSPLSMQKRQNTYFINAFQHFFAHGNAVSMVALVPFNGARFLASGSLDRGYKFWNLEDTSTPQSSTQKGIIADGAWMTHWPCAVISFDDALGYKHTNSYLIPLRDKESRFYPILPTNSPTYTLSVSDYGNSIAHGTLAGEILTIFPHQLIHTKDIDKATQKKRKLSSYIKIIDFTEANCEVENDKKNSKEYQYMPETYTECKDRFGILFCDNLQDTERYAQPQSLYTEKLTAISMEEYPFTSVNRISWNPNTWSYLWLVAGYQNGLVRLLNFKYMSMPRELKAWLPHHVEQMLKKANNIRNEIC
ncbi:PREDICTED: uncharacterized protein LOC107187950 [Dufourea novaeangliae]|uniref:uncharacterized protein LOC107187950 n=1 Tax=Dufourea novaeangliae TaxID=178035 RepID=UPI000766F195|nr:PREDICTED: uncharacterized protein LOC107187950 [Dufourea novaeangliae]